VTGRRRTLTEAEWREVFRLRCASKREERLSSEDLDLVETAFSEDPKRYGEMDVDVFDATLPFGSKVRP
jgi:hypothetical protein